MAMEKTARIEGQATRDIEMRLTGLLEERRSALRDIEPHASPSIDPVAFQTAASHRAVITLAGDAIERLRAGTYGDCIGCGNAIAPARLEAVPYAAACIDCQSRAETA
ncbi:MAG: TraR/DksA family transcriptional regulator [Microbacterium arborescens]